MTQIEIKNKWYKIPTEWNELTAEQLLQVMETIYLKQYPPAKMLLKLLKILAGITYRKWLSLNAGDVEEYIYLTGFLLQPEIGLTKQLIPVYEDLYGPSDEIENIKAGELVFANHYHDKWWADKNDIDALDDLVAVLYRGRRTVDSSGNAYDFVTDPDGDKRELYNENVSAWHADNIIRTWPMAVKLVIATWYAGCRQFLNAENPDVFGGPGEPAKYGLISILRTIAEKGTYGTFEEVIKMPVTMMMIELNETVEEGKRIEQQLNANNAGQAK